MVFLFQNPRNAEKITGAVGGAFEYLFPVLERTYDIVPKRCSRIDSMEGWDNRIGIEMVQLFHITEKLPEITDHKIYFRI